MDLSSYCLILDSGIGGLSIASAINWINYVYFADSKHAPYGRRSKSWLSQRIHFLIRYFYLKKIRIFLLACNTLTTLFIDELRLQYTDSIFVGTVPPVKSLKSLRGPSVILASSKTSKSDYLNNMIRYFARDKKVQKLASTDLVEAIEKGDCLQINKRLSMLDPYKGKIQNLVLGCTHFSLIKNKIQQKLPNSRIIDPNEGVLRQLRKISYNSNIHQTRRIFYTSGNTLTTRKAAELFLSGSYLFKDFKHED